MNSKGQIGEGISLLIVTVAIIIVLGLFILWSSVDLFLADEDSGAKVYGQGEDFLGRINEESPYKTFLNIIYDHVEGKLVRDSFLKLGGNR